MQLKKTFFENPNTLQMLNGAVKPGSKKLLFGPGLGTISPRDTVTVLFLRLNHK
jgi:hypothetical protein